MNSNAGAIIIACVVAAVILLLLATLFTKLNIFTKPSAKARAVELCRNEKSSTKNSRKHHFIVWDSVDDNYYLD